jgi:hypothetical protein
MTVGYFLKNRWVWLIGVVAILGVYGSVAFFWRPQDPENRPFRMYLPVKIEGTKNGKIDPKCEYAPMSVVGGQVYRASYTYDKPDQTTFFFVYDKEGKLLTNRGLAQRNKGVPVAAGENKPGYIEFDFLSHPNAALVSFLMCNEGETPVTFNNVEVRKIGTASQSPFFQLGAETGLYPPILSPTPKLSDKIEDFSKSFSHTQGLTITTMTEGPKALPRRMVKLPEFNTNLDPQQVVWKLDEPITRFRIGGYYLEESITNYPENVLQIYLSADGKNWTALTKSDMLSRYYPQPPDWALYTSEKLDIPTSANYRYLKVEFPLYYQPDYAVQLGLVEIN